MVDLDLRVRLAAFAFLDELQRTSSSDVLSRERLMQGFRFDGQRVPLVSPQQGIFKPRILPLVPLSILTAPVVEGAERPYDDAMGQDGLLEYRYRVQERPVNTRPAHTARTRAIPDSRVFDSRR